VRDDGDLALAAGTRPPDATAVLRRLPPAALEGLREAFAAEVAERLPRLRRAVDAADPADLATAVRDAHALGSSAAVLGEPDASRCAREAERLLLQVQAGVEAAWLPARAEVDELHDRLDGWTA
jgi:HPt (histidine-containing phosphotransfer) domain-containing protein